MKSVLIISFSSLEHDSRVKRQIEFLRSSYTISVAAFAAPSKLDYNFIKLDRPNLKIFNKLVLSIPLLFRLHKISYRLLYGHPELEVKLSKTKIDLIIANDIESLPLAFQINKTKKILLDAHEYSPKQFEDKLSWRFFFQPLNIYICKKFIPKVSAMTTIGKGIADEYRKNFNCNPYILNNATWYNNVDPSLTIPNKIRMIHHGGATVSRYLENMIEMMSYLDDRFTLDIMLVVPEMASAKTRNYINYLKGIAKNDSRINFPSSVKSDEVVNFINRYDIGIVLVPPVNFNYANGLPNKLFEFIQAKLAIGIGPIPEIAQVVNEHYLGVVSENFTAKKLAEKLSAITDKELINFKNNSVKAAKSLSAEKNSVLLNDLIKKVLFEKN